MEYEDRVRISTPEGVDVELTLADIGSRFIAAILDLMIQGGVLLGAALLLGVTGDGDGSRLRGRGVRIIFFLVFFGYDVLFEVRSRGRTLGQALDRAARRAHAAAAGHVHPELRAQRHAAGRHPARALRDRDALDLRDERAISASATSPRARWSCASGPASFKSRATRRAASPVPADGWDVSAVSARDIGTVRQFLGRRGDLAAGPRAELASELERRLRPLVAGAPEHLDPEEFLERLSSAKA